jgi:hypothetical protein
MNSAPKSINPETGTSYSREELKAAFERVENSENWKNPINSIVKASDEELDAIKEAVIFFAGCVPTFLRLPQDQVLVTAVGYYGAVGA